MSSLGSNIKVHFVYNGGPEGIALDLAGAEYRLFSCYDYIKSKKPGDNMVNGSENVVTIKQDCLSKRHVIQDSGLFTMMFGSGKGNKVDFKAISDWQDKLAQFVQQNELEATIVECDAQKLVGPELAWELRHRLKHQLPYHRIINVFHLEDGKDGLDRLIDYSEYIAISVPELRIARGSAYKKDTHHLAKYIKSRKPSIDIHLLGCTEPKMLRENRFCTSSDSSSWLSFVRYGYLKGNHMSAMKPQYEQDLIAKVEREMSIRGIREMKPSLKRWIAMNSVAATYHRGRYEKAAGPQD